MTQSAFPASARTLPESNDFNQDYRNLRKLIHALKLQNGNSVRREIFGEEECTLPFTTREMKDLFRILRKVENHYEQCSTPPIPQELEKSIKDRDSSEWLPWELEAIEKVENWRTELDDKRFMAQKLYQAALDKIRRRKRS